MPEPMVNVTTAVMINQDLDASVLKALRLLHSSDSDSEDQLRQLWKQSVIEKYGNTRMPTSVLHKIQFPSTTKRSPESDEIDEAVENKKLKLETPSVSKSKTSPLHRSAIFSSKDSSDSDADSDSDTPLEIYTADGVCVKCKTSFSSTMNKLVECVDCHRHYHQNCHFPPITDMDLNDPRLVWYCSTCEDNISATNLSDKIKSSDYSSPTKSSNLLKSSRTFGSNYGNKTSVSSGGSSSKPDSSPKHSSILSKTHSSKKVEKKKLIK